MRLGTTDVLLHERVAVAPLHAREHARARRGASGSGPGSRSSATRPGVAIPRLDARRGARLPAARATGSDLEPAAIGGYVDLLRRRGPRDDRRRVRRGARGADRRAQLGSGSRSIRLHVGVPVPAHRAGRSCGRARRRRRSPPSSRGRRRRTTRRSQALLELRERVGGSPAIALVLDFSIAMRAVPSAFVDAVCRAGMRADDLDGIVELWASGAPMRRALRSRSRRRGAHRPSRRTRRARGSCASAGRIRPVWAPLVPLVAHAHAKFWELDAAGDDPTTDNRGVVDVLLAGGFEGVVASEWGGSAWVDVDDVDGFAIVAQHQQLLQAVSSNGRRRARRRSDGSRRLVLAETQGGRRE